MNPTLTYIVIFAHPDSPNVKITERVDGSSPADALSRWVRNHVGHSFVPIYVVPTASGKEAREVRKINVPQYRLV